MLNEPAVWGRIKRNFCQFFLDSFGWRAQLFGTERFWEPVFGFAISGRCCRTGCSWCTRGWGCPWTRPSCCGPIGRRHTLFLLWLKITFFSRPNISYTCFGFGLFSNLRHSRQVLDTEDRGSGGGEGGGSGEGQGVNRKLHLHLKSSK